MTANETKLTGGPLPGAARMRDVRVERQVRPRLGTMRDRRRSI